MEKLLELKNTIKQSFHPMTIEEQMEMEDRVFEMFDALDEMDVISPKGVNA